MPGNSSAYKLTISSIILTKRTSHPFVGCVIQEMRLSHMVSECGKLAQKEYNRRHDSVRRYVHWQFCEKLGFNSTSLWYEHEPDMVVVDKKKKDTMIIDMTIPGDITACDKEREKIEKYSLLKDDYGK